MDITLLANNGTDCGGKTHPELTYQNVIVGVCFVIANSLFSWVLGLGVTRTIVIAATRCLVQLYVLGQILHNVFEQHNIFLVLLIAMMLVFMGAMEVQFGKSKFQFPGMVSVHTDNFCSK